MVCGQPTVQMMQLIVRTYNLVNCQLSIKYEVCLTLYPFSSSFCLILFRNVTVTMVDSGRGLAPIVLFSVLSSRHSPEVGPSD